MILKRMKKKKRMLSQWTPQILAFMKRIIIADGVLQGKKTGIESMSVINTIGIESMKETATETEVEIETGKGTETGIGIGKGTVTAQEKKGTMVEIGSGKETGKAEIEIEERETVGDDGVAQEAEAGTAANETVRMMVIARGVCVTV